MEIRTKTEFYRLWEAGCLGNKLRTWRTIEEALDTEVPVMGLREIGKAGGGAFFVGQRSEVVNMVKDWTAWGRQFMICEAAPDEKGTIQGEVCRAPFGLQGLLGYSNGLRMREALARGVLLPRTGAAVLALLDKYMDPSSQDDLRAMLDLFPEASVEFTCYSCLLGDIPGRNTIFWEVRNY